jgi:murein DD-endopeptidase MepM/ murein hydrolase activator NlpD
MPVGTDIHAARGGVVFEVASTNFRGGVDPERDAASANIVRILHDDGTHAVYAHLNWNSIRVKPGDTVERGEYIADSGRLFKWPAFAFCGITKRRDANGIRTRRFRRPELS